MTRTLADFVGLYELRRQIDDRNAQSQSRFEGRARIEPAEGGALYVETGQLIMGAGRFEAERRYLWRDGAGRIDVDFDDGRAFHTFDPVRGGDATRHLCGADWYLGGYDFVGWPSWQVTWHVSGPRKDYTSVSVYRPVSA